MAENRTYTPPNNLPIAEPEVDVVSPVETTEPLQSATQQGLQEPFLPTTPQNDPLVVVPSEVPPVQPSITLTLEEIQQEAKALGISPAPTTDTTVPPPQEPPILVRTYEDDMARAMNVTDAKVVQELMRNAKEREEFDELEIHNKKARGWYTAGSIILLLVALASLAYGAYYYTRLTVPVTGSVSVGVFSNTEPVPIPDTTIESVLTRFSESTLTVNKPYLINLVGDTATQAPLTKSAFFAFLGINTTEPFAASFSSVRLGIMDTGEKTLPFIIGSLENPEVSIKEFLIAEPSMLEMFSRSLAIDTTTIAPEANKNFVGEYRYNVPVRTLYTTDTTGLKTLTLLYAFVTDSVVVITTEPSVLKAVYDTILSQ